MPFDEVADVRVEHVVRVPIDGAVAHSLEEVQLGGRGERDELLGVAASDSGSKVSRRSDSFGFQWIVIHDRDFEDLVTTTHLVSSELQARGFGGQLLAATFKFTGRDDPVYLIYGYKTATFWPFVPTGNEQERDNAEELKLKSELEKELPIEPDLSRWLALFDAPLD